jgi:pyridoxal phosphate enzyme (YggS family)
MPVNFLKLFSILKELKSFNAQLVAVSKTKPKELIKEVYNTGHKVFGENYVQELSEKQEQLPNDIQWHFIGHLQSNKVKYIAPYVSLIHGIDNFKLLKEINNQAAKNNRIINCLLQIHIAQEETKFGLSYEECSELLKSDSFKLLNNICITGFMGMATNTDDNAQIRKEFKSLSAFFIEQKKKQQLQTTNFKPQTLSMGMTSDYKIALEEGSTMVRIGSAIFGER